MMSGEFAAFILLAVSAIGGAVLMINLTKVIHMMIALVFTFISVAGIYVLLSAEFVAVVQIMIYSGAITIIMLFGIMLTSHRDVSSTKAPLWRRIMILSGIAGFAIAIYYGIYDLNFRGDDALLHVNNTEKLGIEIFTKYIIPFELLSVLLLVALVGAVILSKKDDEEEEKK